MAAHEAPPADVSGALAALDELAAYRHLPQGLAVAVFLSAGAAGVVAFFLLADVVLWDGIDEFVAEGLLGMAWVMVFPIWVVGFVAALVALDGLRMVDVRAAARRRLPRLALGRDDLTALAAALREGNRRHADIFAAVVDELAAGD